MAATCFTLWQQMVQPPLHYSSSLCASSSISAGALCTPDSAVSQSSPSNVSVCPRACLFFSPTPPLPVCLPPSLPPLCLCVCVSPSASLKDVCVMSRTERLPALPCRSHQIGKRHGLFPCTPTCLCSPIFMEAAQTKPVFVPFVVKVSTHRREHPTSGCKKNGLKYKARLSCGWLSSLCLIRGDGRLFLQHVQYALHLKRLIAAARAHRKQHLLGFGASPTSN